MARISKLDITNEFYVTRSGVSECVAELNVYKHFGEPMVRLQTFGSNTRQEKGKQSQVLHIDKHIAIELVKALKESFDI